MRLVVSDNILKWTSVLVAILWLSPTVIEFTVTLGNQAFSWSAFVLLFLLPIIGFIYLIFPFLIRKWWLFFFGLVFVFSFPITMALGAYLLGP